LERLRALQTAFDAIGEGDRDLWRRLKRFSGVLLFASCGERLRLMLAVFLVFFLFLDILLVTDFDRRGEALRDRFPRDFAFLTVIVILLY